MSADTPAFDPSTFTLREATTREKIACWQTNSASWAGKLTPEDYLQREAINGSGDLTRDGGIRYWVFTAPAPAAKNTNTNTNDQDDDDKNNHNNNNSNNDDDGADDSAIDARAGDKIYAAVETLRKTVAVKTADGGFAVEPSYGVASVFTPPEYRGRKVAAWMMRRLAEWFDGEEAACRFSVLYSDVGEYYSRLGWPSCSSLETYLPPTPSSTTSTSTKPLTRTDLPPLCEHDVAALTATIRDTPLPPATHARLAFLPTYAQAAWHFGAEEYIAAKLYAGAQARTPDVKGAVSASGRTWGYWVHDYNDDKLIFLRLVSPAVEPLSSSSLSSSKAVGQEGSGREDADANANADEESLVREVADVLRAAQSEAAAWTLKKVVLWNPDARTVEACKLVLGRDDVKVQQRTDGSIPCLRWKGADVNESKPKVVDWVALEKYSWC